MNAELLDGDGYPRVEVAEAIKNWEITKFEDCITLLEYVGDVWKYKDWGWERDGNEYHISTGGWSGNEELMAALEQNWMFWNMCWVQSRRGGHYIFEVHPAIEKVKEG